MTSSHPLAAPTPLSLDGPLIEAPNALAELRTSLIACLLLDGTSTGSKVLSCISSQVLIELHPSILCSIEPTATFGRSTGV